MWTGCSSGVPGGDVMSLPAAWTDAVAPDPFVVAAGEGCRSGRRICWLRRAWSPGCGAGGRLRRDLSTGLCHECQLDYGAGASGSRGNGLAVRQVLLGFPQLTGLPFGVSRRASAASAGLPGHGRPLPPGCCRARRGLRHQPVHRSPRLLTRRLEDPVTGPAAPPLPPESTPSSAGCGCPTCARPRPVCWPPHARKGRRPPRVAGAGSRQQSRSPWTADSTNNLAAVPCRATSPSPSPRWLRPQPVPPAPGAQAREPRRAG